MFNRLLKFAVCLSLIGLVAVGCGGGEGTGTTGTSSPTGGSSEDPPAGASTTATANAGLDQAIVVGQTITLDGSKSAGATSYRWTFLRRPSGSNASIVGSTSVTAFFVPDAAGTYEIQLSVNGGESIDTVVFTATETLGAVANAGVDQTISLGKTVTLDGSGSLRAQTAQWSFVSNPATSSAKISDATRFIAAVTPDVEGTYVLQLSVNGGESTDTVTVTVNRDTAQANAGNDQSASAGKTVSLDGTASTGVTNARWAFIYKPGGSAATITDATSLAASFVPDKGGDYILQLSINDGESLDTVTVTVSSISGSVGSSGPAIRTRTRFGVTEYAVNLGATGAMLSAESLDVAPGQTVASYSWEQIAGPAATIAGATDAETLTFTAPTILGLYGKADHYKWQVLPISREDTKMTFRLTATASDSSTHMAIVDVYLEDNGAEIYTTSGLPNVPLGQKIYMAGPTYYVDPSGIQRQVKNDWVWKYKGQTTSGQQVVSYVMSAVGSQQFTYSSKSAGVAETNFSVNVSTFAGVGVDVVKGNTAVSPQCGWCHSKEGGNASGSLAPKYVEPWKGTRHASIFQQNMDAYADLVLQNGADPYLWPYHTVGYNTDTDLNNGFDDMATLESFVFPTEGMTYTDFLDNYPKTASRANVQCENCHGPGNDHTGDKSKIAYSFSQAGVCGQCHTQEAEWTNSRHHSTGVVGTNAAYQTEWLTNSQCKRCHYSGGFVVDYLSSVEPQDEFSYADDGGYMDAGNARQFAGVTCSTCHSPHSKKHDRQLRLYGNVTMKVDGSTVDAGRAAVCYQCHDGFYAYAYAYGNTQPFLCDSNGNGVIGDSNNGDKGCTSVQQTAFENFQPSHFNNQAAVLEGKGVILDLNNDGEDDFDMISNSKHGQPSFILPGNTENLKCLTCHMAAGPTTEENGYRRMGGHAFAMRSGTMEFTKACEPCHSVIPTINRNLGKDYDGDTVLEGIQDEVKGLLLALATRIKAIDPANISGGTWSDADGIQVAMLKYVGAGALPAGKTCASVDKRDDYAPCNLFDTALDLRSALWNYNFIAGDRSLGIHNTRFIVQVLQQTYTALDQFHPDPVDPDIHHTFSDDYPKALIAEDENASE